jgi:hypothetical protein
VDFVPRLARAGLDEFGSFHWMMLMWKWISALMVAFALVVGVAAEVTLRPHQAAAGCATSGC